MSARVALLLGLAGLDLGLAGALWRTSGPPTTYVLTPFVELAAPAGDCGEAVELARGVEGRISSREVQRGLAWLGSTLSLDVLLAGIEALDGPLAPDAGQRERLAELLEPAREQHEELYRVQGRILDLEARIAGRAARIRAALPAELRQRLPAAAGPPSPGAGTRGFGPGPAAPRPPTAFPTRGAGGAP